MLVHEHKLTDKSKNKTFTLKRKVDVRISELQVLQRRMRDECAHTVSMEKRKREDAEKQCQELSKQLEGEFHAQQLLCTLCWKQWPASLSLPSPWADGGGENSDRDDNDR